MNQDDGHNDPLYPAIEPFASGELAVSGGHRIYFEQSGRPDGFPVLFLHGGPGSQSRPQHRRYFDPSYYRIVLFDQRGCGRSMPAGETAENTTAHLIADIERLRRELGVERWLLFGGSWGSALALAYSVAYPGRVAGLILRGVFLASSAELDWFLHGLRAFIPEQVAKLHDGERGNLLQRYHAEVNHPDRRTAFAAAQRWMAYEEQVMGIGNPAPDAANGADQAAAINRTRVQMHYLASDCFLRERELLESAWRVTSHAIIVQGRLDMVCPPVTAYELSRCLPSCELRMIESGGHSGAQPAIAQALRRAADDMRTLVSQS